ncbi:GNAT family N-acetyltransferase [Streptomyces sp. NPDC002564]|uniref:GNAT family N-acetyltransferase n=1 Tax=Streptomyces sp. NPDC002564 TaxID=3364649 RepID=UPI003689BE51
MSGAAVVRRVTGTELRTCCAPGVRAVYAAAFGQPPWNEEPAAADAYLERLAADAARPGFTAAVAFDGPGTCSGSDGPAPRAIGFATAWATEAPLPDSRSYPQVAAALGAARTEEWLHGARQIDELAVRPDAHGLGAGRALLAAVTRDAPDGRCWLLTSAQAVDAVRFYRRVGWHQVTHPAEGGRGVAVFLGPDHPAAAASRDTGEEAPARFT